MENKMIKDDDFISSKDVPGPTKEEIRCLLLCKSEVSNSDIVVDIGCGTGGVTTEFGKIAKKVISIDKNPKAIELTSKNIKKHGVANNVDLIQNDAVSALESIENFDIAIIGGSGGDIDKILELVSSKLNPNGRILVTGILIETRYLAINKLKKLGLIPKIIEVNISRGRDVGIRTMMIAENPIAIIYSKITSN